ALEWSPDRRTLTGTASLQLRAVQPASQIMLELAGSYAVDGVSVDGAAVTASQGGRDRLTVQPAHPLAAGAAATVTVRYHGTPHEVPVPGHRADVTDSGTRVLPDGALYAMEEPYGAYTWFPCSDQPSDKALLDTTITVPVGWSGVTSGRLTGT